MTQNTTDQVQQLVAALVSRESENPPGNESAVATFVRDWLRDRGVDASLVRDPDPDRPQVAARVGDGDPTVVLNGHIDVVPAGDREQWSRPPYEGVVEDGTLYGRGSADMKSGVAVAMLATVAFKQRFENDDLDGSVVFHAAMGEETAEPGTKTLLEAGYDGDYGVVLEPTGLRTATSEKGLAWYEITVGGDPSHASRPDFGDNAITNARPVLDALAEYDERVRERTDDLVGRAYATVTGFDAGTKENVVPESAVLTVDRRFLPAESIADVDAELERVLDEVAEEHGLEIDCRRTRTYESASIPVDSPFATVFREHAAALGDVDDTPWGISASTDVRNLVNDADVEAITWGPGDLDQAHTFDERIDLDEVRVALDVLENALVEVFEAEG